MSIAFKHLCNDYYCKDLSRKVKSGYRTKWESGKYLASYAVFGYRKSDKDMYKLAVDETTAPIVRRIFDMALAGSKPSQIATTLNAERVPTPAEYLMQTRNLRAWSDLRPIWTGTEITRILRDMRYVGTMTNGMYAVEKVGSRQAQIKPQSEWYITPGTHEPIVSQDEFERAGRCIRANKSKGVKYGPRVPSPHSLPVTVRCGGCGHAMVKNGAKVMAYYCKCSKMAACDTCFTGKIEVDMLKDILLTSIQRLQDAIMEQKKAASVETAAPSSDYVKQIGLLQREIERISSDKLTLYNAYSDGEMEREEYFTWRKQTDDRIQELTAQVELLEREHWQEISVQPVIPASCEFLEDEQYPLRYSNEIVTALVEHVIVYDENRVEIKWKFTDTVAVKMAGRKEDACGTKE